MSLHRCAINNRCPRLPVTILEGDVITEAFGPTVESCGAAVGMNDAERTRFQELATPGSPDYLLDQPDYYCLQTSVLATGRV
ncbi:MAG: hypothetical protein R3A44_00725 [Caldilineaceae bacterium]